METDVIVRPICEGEKAEAQRVMRRAFPPLARLFFSWSKDVLVAEHNGAIVGGIVLKIFTPRRDLKVGFISWVFTDPDARGLGAGQRLIEGALDFFAEEGCDEVAACVEGYNSSSSKLFATRGFTILSPGEQVRRYGLGILPYWWHSYHLVDLGHFLWVKPGAERPDSPALQWMGTWLINVMLLYVIAWRHGTFGLTELWSLPVTLLLLFGLRTAAMWSVARAQGLAVRYRAWESSVALAAAMALLFGVYVPFPGNLYPVGDRWRYRDLLPKLGPMALAGSLVSLALTWVSWAALRFDLAPQIALLWIPLFGIGRILALLETAIAFFPLVSFNGRRILDWSRLAWALFSLAAVALLFVA